MKKFFTVVLLSIVACGMIFANGGAETADVDSANAPLSYWNIAIEGNDKVITDTAVNAYNAAPVAGVVIENNPIQNDQYKQKLVIAMSSGECPDLYSSWSGGPLFEYVDSGFAQPLEDLFNASPIKDKIMPAAIAQATYKGHLWGIPYQNLSISGIFYNKEIFAKCGLDIPETIGELEEACEVLVDNGYIPFTLANKNKWTGSMYFMNLAARIGGLEPFQKAVSGEGTFLDPSFIEAGNILQRWVKKGFFPEGVNSLDEDQGQAKQLMYQEKAAMLLCGSWYAGNFKFDSEEFYEKVGWFPVPAYEGSPEVDSSIMIGTVGDQFLSINPSVTGERLEAAWDFIEEYFTDELINKEIELGKIPPVVGVENLLGDDEVVLDIVKAAGDASSIQLWYDQYLPPQVATAHLDGLQEVFGLTKTPEQAMQMMQDAIEAYRASK